MTSAAFRKLALTLFAAAEGSHMGHADFRANGRIFASLPPRPKGWDEDAAMVKLTAAQQRELVEEAPEVFQPVPGGWGVKGATYVRLKRAKVGLVRRALKAAWGNVCGMDLQSASEQWRSGSGRGASGKGKPRRG